MRRRDREIQRAGEREPALRERGRERLAEALDDQRDMVPVANDLAELDHAVAAQRAQQLVLVLNPPSGLDRDQLAGGLLDHHRQAVGGAHRPPHGRPRARVELANDAVTGERVGHPGA